ncbi:ADP-ribosylglycohydrolase family protein [Clostridium sp. JNZ X4-2]|uniref:ADP-ribosyl-[dinitrogen reductase] glycohydrolase n=1 Tax=Clostridium luticellarii TaxID=1691940 RepID=A0A2T0BD87_9CLOT|nr:ADP-ribosylglycohydrolase family protein [Clostridium luticellarii]PRR81803.1 ADP-ribosyl-[dinitrogen reductase] glycohydrolase [Clostridium luticellarii]
MTDLKDLFMASLLCGALGDALGYPVEFMTWDEIKYRFGKQGIEDLKVDKAIGKALISDDTQMSLFTADGMIWAYLRCSERGIGSYSVSGIYQSYLRWYYTQTGRMPTDEDKVWLEKQPHEKKNSILDFKELFSERAPGNSCLTALGSGKMGTMDEPVNNSKGCGGVMRVAPVGLFLHGQPEYAFRVAAEAAAMTHGHPTGYLAAGTFAAIVAELVNGKDIIESTRAAIDILKIYRGHEETVDAVEKALRLAESSENSRESIKKLGEGWIAEEALAIALYCALKGSDVKKALIMAVNHDGDSDSTGAICGNILGAAYGMKSIPEKWIENVQLKDLIMNMGCRLFDLSK